MKRKPKPQNKLKYIEDALDNPNSSFFKLTNDLLALVTVLSVLAIVLETVSTFHKYHTLFKLIEYGATALFTFEYTARIFYAHNKPRYIFSFFGLVDLVSILPTYLGLGNFTFLKTARVLRIIRLLRMIRLLKLAKIKKADKDGSSSLYTLNIQIYSIALLSSVLILGGLFYLFEGGEVYASDIPSAMYWVFKAIIGGMSYPQPETTGGIIVLIAARFCSMILLGLMLSLVGTILRKLLIGSEKDS